MSIEVVQFIKTLNKTDLGMTGTHDRMIHIPASINIGLLFGSILTTPTPFNLKDKKSQNVYKMNTKHENKSNRIKSLGSFFTDKNLLPGDELTIEKRTIDKTNEIFYIDFNKKVNRCFIKKITYGSGNINYEVLNDDIDIFSVKYNADVVSSSGGSSSDVLSIYNKRDILPNANSSVPVTVYDISIGGKPIDTVFNVGDFIEIIKISKNEVIIKNCEMCQMLRFKV